jgi:serine/threonine protein phosphatase PrpC
MNFQGDKNQVIIENMFNLDNKFEFVNFEQTRCSSEDMFVNLNNLISMATTSPSSKRRITSGFSGQAKNLATTPELSFTDETRTFNYGDDVGFIFGKNMDSSTSLYFGIADGVSANRQRGYDASKFPLALLNACTYMLENQSAASSSSSSSSSTLSSLASSPIAVVDPDGYFNFTSEECFRLYSLMDSSHHQVIDECVYGSSTVCLLSLKFNDETQFIQLSTCNLGDSGYMLMRGGQVVFKSDAQSHRYNAPYQIGCTPPELLEHDLYRDTPKDSICLTHEIKAGDFLVLSTDGLFDNLYEDEIALIINNHIQNHSQDTKTVINPLPRITSDLLNSTCDLLVQKACKAGIKRDDMLIILIYIE